MTWIPIQTKDWLKEGEPYTLLGVFLYVLAEQKKGRVSSTVRDLAYIWVCTEPRVTKFLDELTKMGLIQYDKLGKDITIEVINFSEYPVLSHQKPVPKVVVRAIRDIEGRLPIPTLTREENFAAWLWRSIQKVVGPNHKVLNSAYLDDWAKQIRYMWDLDGRKDTEMAEVVKWALNDSFWSTVLRSAKGLREHYDKMVDKKN